MENRPGKKRGEEERKILPVDIAGKKMLRHIEAPRRRRTTPENLRRRTWKQRKMRLSLQCTGNLGTEKSQRQNFSVNTQSFDASIKPDQREGAIPRTGTLPGAGGTGGGETPPADPRRRMLKRFGSDRIARIGVAGILILLLPAIYAPLLANGRPLWMATAEGWSFPFLRYLFSPDAPEKLIEQIFNFAALFLPFCLIACAFLRRCPLLKRGVLIAGAVLLLIPFLLTKERTDKRDYRTMVRESGASALFAPIPYGPFELSGEPSAAPGQSHLLGCDSIGRDLASRLIYGARVSLAVGLLGTLIALAIGCTVGLAAGFFRGWFDLLTMRVAEILLCFPTFLLLLILMSILGDRKIGQSIPLVTAVIGLTGWIGVAMLVRGEVLKQSALPYIQCCTVAGMSARRIMFHHLLPNIAGTVLICFTFGVAGAILAESGLSFLGFGVQPPSASWGDLLRQAFDNPLDHWHLTFFPGAALFIAVLSFNFTGEGLRRAFSPEQR